MKKILPLLLSFSLFPSTSHACADLSSYGVENLEFNRLTVHQAISEIMKGKPYQVIYAAPDTHGLVNATGVTGRLDGVLKKLLDRFDLDYTQNGCEIRILQKSQYELRLKAGEMLNDRLGDWLKNRGYTLFWEAQKYRVNGALTIAKPVDEALSEVVSIMRSNGVNLVVEIYDNHAVRVTEVK